MLVHLNYDPKPNILYQNALWISKFWLAWSIWNVFAVISQSITALVVVMICQFWIRGERLKTECNIILAYKKAVLQEKIISCQLKKHSDIKKNWGWQPRSHWVILWYGPLNKKRLKNLLFRDNSNALSYLKLSLLKPYFLSVLFLVVSEL